MTEQPTMEPATGQPDGGSGGKIVVLFILLLIGGGTAAWFTMDHGRDVLDKGTGTKFAAAFEKECQPKHGKDLCKEVAGVNHARCLRLSASKAESGVDYDRKIYLECLRDALDSATGGP